MAQQGTQCERSRLPTDPGRLIRDLPTVVMIERCCLLIMFINYSTNQHLLHLSLKNDIFVIITSFVLNHCPLFPPDWPMKLCLAERDNIHSAVR